ncbi:hypothetical protein ACSSS7_005984 [Eimeria intestinalis]
MNSFRVRHLEQALQLYYAPHSTGHLPLDLFLRHYYKCNKSVGSHDKKFITEHIYQIVKWKGLLDHITPPPASWSSRIRTYFVSDSDMPEFQRGYFEIQDEASQLAALKVAAKPGDKVLDYCAGSGGKTLAFGPQMENKGKIYLHDVRHRMLQEAKKRLKRARIANYTILPEGSPVLPKLAGSMDWVVCDVPCSGTGALRRSPEMKWKYEDDKRHIFSRALQYAKPKTGKIVYITCSILDEENVQQVFSLKAALFDSDLNRVALRAAGFLIALLSFSLPPLILQVKFFCQQHGLVLTEPPFHSLPTSHGMDGFFCATFSHAG